MDHPIIELPQTMSPTDGRFGSGPSLVRQEAVLDLALSGRSYLGTSHRSEPIKQVVQEIQQGLSTLFSLPDGYEVVLGVGGTTVFWDCAAFSLIEQRSEHLVLGEFSAKFAAVTTGAPHLDDPVLIESEPGTAPQLDPSAEVDTFALIHNETSTGVMMPVERPRDSGLVLVDATSAAGAMPVEAGEFDVYYFSPQKAFGSEGGLWIALISPAALDRVDRLAARRWIPPSLDLGTAIENSRKRQTYNTPALATLWLLRSQVAWMLEMGGLDWACERSAATSGHVYEWAESSKYASPFVADPTHRSTTVATVDLDEVVDVSIVSSVLRANGIVDIEGYRKLGRNQLRIACFPNIEPANISALTAAIDYVVEQL
jgi:phosphoserine aminotransferase